MDTLDISFVNRILHSNITEVLLVFLVSLFSGRYIYSYFKHRSKNYPPGPIGIPILGYLPFIGPEPHKTLFKLKEKYGSIIGLYLGSKYTIVLNDWAAVKEVLPHSNALDRAPNLFDHIPSVGFASASGKEWVEQRRFCVFASRDLGVGKGPWETIITEEVQCFIKELQQFKGKATEISHILSSSVSSNILSFLIGRRLRKEEEPEKVELSRVFADAFSEYTGTSNVSNMLPWLRKYFVMFKIAGYDKVSKIVSSFCQLVKDEVSRHKTSPEFKDVNDFINIYLQKISELRRTSNVAQHFFSELMLEGNLTVLFLGASETIFTSLGWLLRLMAKHRDVQQKVYDELMTVFGKDGVARYEERHKIPYTFAVMMEQQRVSSVLPFNTPRCVSKEFSVRGYTIPKGAEIAGNLWALHNDPEYWDEPEKFRPERFFQDEGRVLVKSPPSYAPFSLGRRNCPGETIAWMEILFYFSEVIKKFEICTEDGKEPTFEVSSGLVGHLKPQPLCFKERAQY